jgi:hypothetical protein
MSNRATTRPGEFRKPAYWDDTAAPAPGPASGEAEELGPTRYGDWVRKGVAVDF